MKNKNILIINSLSLNIDYIFSALQELKYRGYNPHLLSIGKQERLRIKFEENKLSLSKIYLHPCNFIFFILFPLFFFYYTIYLYYLKKSKKISSIFLFGSKEKNIFTLLASMLNLKIFWVQFPGKSSITNKKNIFNKFNITFVNKIIALNAFTKEQLACLGVPENKIKVINLGIKLNENQIQDNIFDKLARDEQEKRSGKFFTIGLIAELNQDQNIKALFFAIKDCLKAIPNIQLIVVGDGAERKNFSWLAKTMNIDNLVWFVGQQINLKKWLHGFDLLVVTNPFPNLLDFGITLNAMQNGIPVIAQRHVGLEEMLDTLHKKLKTLIDIKDSHAIARKIVDMQQSVVARKKLEKLSKLKIKEKFKINIMVDEIVKLIND